MSRTAPRDCRTGIRPYLAALAAGALVAVGCTGEPERDEPDAGPFGGAAQADWQPCPEVPEEVLGGVDGHQRLTGDTTYECATLVVPQDWDAPEEAGTFQLALVRARTATAPDRIGSMVVNPGGPGASGVDTAIVLSLPEDSGGLPAEVTRHFDIVGFDPRGVGRSSPVDCYSDEDLDELFGSDVDTSQRAGFDAAAEEFRAYGEACGAQYGEVLDYYSTRQTAHDLDAIREVAGDEQLTYLGYSYGTLLGSVYAQLFPDRVRAMVLDGAVDPTADAIDRAELQAAGFERAFENFATWCDETPECRLGDDTLVTVTDLMEQVGESPVPPADGADDDRQATGGWLGVAISAALYQEDLWPLLAVALEQLGDGDPEVMFALADGYVDRDADGNYSNTFDAYFAITCADDATDVTVSQAWELQEQWSEEYPMFGGSATADILQCSQWPAGDDPYPTGEAQGAPPILVIGTRGDPATPYESTAELADMLGVGVVLTYEGEGHTAYPQPGCIDDAVNSYLVDLTVPEDGLTCPA